MKRELFIHFSFWLFYFVLIAIVKHFLTLSYWPFWVGGVLGVFLPDIDHIIYVLSVGPQELTSQRLNYLWQKKEYLRMIQLLYETRGERKGLIFHTIFFQIIFLVLTFLVISSSSSLFGTGLALSFALHLSVDQIVDIVDMGSLGNWTKYLSITLDKTKSEIYWITALLLTGLLGLLI